MPYVNVQITPAASRDQKRAIVADITRSLVERLGKTPEQIHIVIQDVEEENWGFAGQLTDEWRAQNAKASGKSISRACPTGRADLRCKVTKVRSVRTPDTNPLTEPLRQKRWVLSPCPTLRRINHLAMPEPSGKTGAVLAGLRPALLAAKTTLFAAVFRFPPSH